MKQKSLIKAVTGMTLAIALTLSLSALPAAAADEAQTLDSDTIQTLLHMREEEKLARDIYLTLYEVHGANLFQNIARSEQSHMDAVLTLLNTYGIPDPVGSHGIGEFSEPAFTALYNNLVAEGSTSLMAAYGVGVTIEELDIADLQSAIAATSEADILNVYQRLLAGSQNHLRAFTQTGGQAGAVNGNGNGNGNAGSQGSSGGFGNSSGNNQGNMGRKGQEQRGKGR